MDEKRMEKSTAFTRVLKEKEDLDEKITGLNNFLNNFRGENGKYDYEAIERKVGSEEAAVALFDQFEAMLTYSKALNTRILVWYGEK